MTAFVGIRKTSEIEIKYFREKQNLRPLTGFLIHLRGF